MPSWKAHLVLGIIFTAIVLFINAKYYNFINLGSWKDYVWFLPILFFYALIPDADSQASAPRLIITVIGIGSTIYFVWFNLKIKALIVLGLLFFLWIARFIGIQHRGELHSIIGITLLAVPLYFLGGFKLFILGWIFAFSHLLFDAMGGGRNTLKLWD